MVPAPSTTDHAGRFSCAAPGALPSPLYAATPVPAVVVMVPGMKEICGALPTPESPRVYCKPPLSVSVRGASRTPGNCGANVTSAAQIEPAAFDEPSVQPEMAPVVKSAKPAPV